ncbi:MAG: hypothetical protein J6127_05990 [Clostridiales bacterium]|nr:hypothetical protein [Clostridiales bacterium]
MSTLETAVVFTAVMFVLSGLIVLPAHLCNDTLAEAQNAVEDVLSREEDDMSPEGLNTFFTGISENYRMIYGALLGEVPDEEE